MSRGAASTVRVALNEDAFAALVNGRCATLRGFTDGGVMTIEIILSDIGFARMSRAIADAAGHRAGRGAPHGEAPPAGGFGLRGEPPKIPQSLGLTILRLVDTVELLRRVLGGYVGELDQTGRVAVLKGLEAIQTVPAELMLACEIIAEEMPDVDLRQFDMLSLWGTAYDEIDSKRERFEAAMEAEDAAPRH